MRLAKQHRLELGIMEMPACRKFKKEILFVFIDHLNERFQQHTNHFFINFFSVIKDFASNVSSCRWSGQHFSASGNGTGVNY